MSDFLALIRDETMARVRNIKIQGSISSQLNRAEFSTMFRENENCFIAEIKFASPSRGTIYQGNLNHLQLADQYIENGATALSVLTEPSFFKGNIQYIKDIRNRFPHVPILLKDFVLSEVQIQEAVAVGASAVLLIADCLSYSRLRELYHYALNLGITPLIEISNSDGVELIKLLNLKLLLINNRNLKTQAVNLAASEVIINKIHESYGKNHGVDLVSASGIAEADEINTLSNLGYNGFLLGTALMRHANPGETLGNILEKVIKK